MTDDVAAWIVGACVAAVIGILARAVQQLFIRMREMEAREGAEARKVRGELNDLHLLVVQNYIRREDWVPMTSRIIGMLEDHGQSLTAHGERLARIDERVNGCKDLHNV